ncbi:hypothetical protein CSKR_109739 [Clonorchis sinensis]|uniref:Uncharacterized protein n=1 Tax=Clonorchis sinensis TaxID=79923 RepID=A0A3R7G403_CLOSI|nr:hypothetical protein CSKR_109739 [Clonorchis sinensis]
MAQVGGSNTASASRLLLSRLGQPGSIPALVQPSGGMAKKTHGRNTTAIFRTSEWESVNVCECENTTVSSHFIGGTLSELGPTLTHPV